MNYTIASPTIVFQPYIGATQARVFKLGDLFATRLYLASLVVDDVSLPTTGQIWPLGVK